MPHKCRETQYKPSNTRVSPIGYMGKIISSLHSVLVDGGTEVGGGGYTLVNRLENEKVWYT